MPTRSFSWFLLCLLLPILLLVSEIAPAQQQNLLQNGDFDFSLAAWPQTSDPTRGSVTWSSTDLGGSPTSGSLRLTTIGYSSASASQCVSRPSALFTLSSSVRFRLVSGGGVFLVVSLFRTLGCIGPATSYVRDDYSLLQTFPAPPPRNTLAVDSFQLSKKVQSLRVDLYAQSASGEAPGVFVPAEAFFDGAFLGPLTTPVSLLRFTAE